jgi:Endomembrane protein 70
LDENEIRKGAIKHKQRLGESIVGDRRETSPYDIHFMDDIELRTLCTKTYNSKELKRFKEAIANNYFFEMFIEDLPMWGYVGDIDHEDLVLGDTSSTRYYLFPHLHFHLGYNGDQVVSAKITTDVSIMWGNCRNSVASLSLKYFPFAVYIRWNAELISQMLMNQRKLNILIR